MEKKEFTATEVMVLQEQTLKEVRVIGEGLNYVMEKVKRIDVIEEIVDNIENEIKTIKLSLTQKANLARIQDHEKRIIKLEEKVILT